MRKYILTAVVSWQVCSTLAYQLWDQFQMLPLPKWRKSSWLRQVTGNRNWVRLRTHTAGMKKGRNRGPWLHLTAVPSLLSINSILHPLKGPLANLLDDGKGQLGLWTQYNHLLCSEEMGENSSLSPLFLKTVTRFFLLGILSKGYLYIQKEFIETLKKFIDSIGLLSIIWNKVII